VPPEEAAETEAEPEEEADCLVLADVDEDFGTAPFTAHFNVEFECEGGGGAVAWDFGDGSPPSYEIAPTHTYTKPGEYVARVTVTAPDGLTAYDELDITVEGGEEGEETVE